MFAALVSSGRGAEGSEQFTPRGEHRVWVKLRSSDMDNLENVEARENYAIQAVPWVMYFERGYGLHGTFWHRAFGRVQNFIEVAGAQTVATFTVGATPPSAGSAPRGVAVGRGGDTCSR